jgi:hypothetical protein
MARGDVTIFDQFKLDMVDKVFNLDADTINIGLIDNAVTPGASDASPNWGAGSGTDYSAHEVGTGGGYTGPTDVGGATSKSGGTTTFDLTTNPTWSQNASGATDIYWGIIYDDTPAGKNAIGFIDMGGPVSIVAGDVTITWNGSGLFTIS